METPGDSNPNRIHDLHESNMIAAAIRAEIDLYDQETEAAIEGGQAVSESASWDTIKDGNVERRNQLQEGFFAARSLAVYLSYHNDRWRLNNFMVQMADTFEDSKLIHLIVLSRIDHSMSTQHRMGLNPHDVWRAINALAEEMGVESVPASRFPGITTDMLIEAILDGRVRIGN